VFALRTLFYGRDNPGGKAFEDGNKKDDNRFIKKTVEGKTIFSFVCVQHNCRGW